MNIWGWYAIVSGVVWLVLASICMYEMGSKKAVFGKPDDVADFTSVIGCALMCWFWPLGLAASPLAVPYMLGKRARLRAEARVASDDKSMIAS